MKSHPSVSPGWATDSHEAGTVRFHQVAIQGMEQIRNSSSPDTGI
ncbi:rCG52411 [Rattus norvegicus]|uniref:RCG52411 n=1 Tax=Rattus norvegicus TaxID=10116 RepID=A6K0P4_RAT|nr:rCG52411 [Rattus norvegicus]